MRYKQNKQIDGTGRPGRYGATRGGAGRDRTGQHGSGRTRLLVRARVFCLILFLLTLPFGVEQTKDGSFPTNLDTPNSMRATRGAEMRYKQNKQIDGTGRPGRYGATRGGAGRDRTGQHGSGRTRLLVRARVFCLILFLLTLPCGHQIGYRCSVKRYIEFIGTRTMHLGHPVLHLEGSTIPAYHRCRH